MKKYTKDGKLLIPLSRRHQGEEDSSDVNVRYIISEAYCPKGCNIMDTVNKIKDLPSIRIKFKREGCEGEFLISAIEGDFEKIIISGKLEEGVKDELFCPHCGTMFEKLIHCNCHPDSDIVLIGLTPRLDFNNAIAFCNVTGCQNGSFIKSGEILRHVRLGTSFDR